MYDKPQKALRWAIVDNQHEKTKLGVRPYLLAGTQPLLTENVRKKIALLTGISCKKDDLKST